MLLYAYILLGITLMNNIHNSVLQFIRSKYIRVLENWINQDFIMTAFLERRNKIGESIQKRSSCHKFKSGSWHVNNVSKRYVTVEFYGGELNGVSYSDPVWYSIKQISVFVSLVMDLEGGTQLSLFTHHMWIGSSHKKNAWYKWLTFWSSTPLVTTSAPWSVQWLERDHKQYVLQISCFDLYTEDNICTIFVRLQQDKNKCKTAMIYFPSLFVFFFLMS